MWEFKCIKTAWKKTEALEMKFLLSFAGYKLCDHKMKEEIVELRIYNLNANIFVYMWKWIQYLWNMTDTGIPKIVYKYTLVEEM
jgi:hypothetical protein